jgi:DNA invertase Pin-like site-specific DNA recombinase
MRVAMYRRAPREGGELALHWQSRVLSSYVEAHPEWRVVIDTSDIGLTFAQRIGEGGLGRLLAEAEAGHLDAVLVTRPDCLARKPDDLAEVLGRLHAARVQVLVAAEAAVGHTTPTAKTLRAEDRAGTPWVRPE